jgi:alkylation response protein AidB-like acyl-CoA dehydrogenase
MNQPVPTEILRLPQPLTAHSPDLQVMFDHIAKGEAERDRVMPHAIIDLIRHARLGALRIPSVAGGGGCSVRELFTVVIRLATADANVANMLRNRFSVAEDFVDAPQDEQGRKWRQDIVDGVVIGLANAELYTARIGNVAHLTALTRDGDDYRLNGTKYYSTGAARFR